jgi:hypothetical protein
MNARSFSAPAPTNTLTPSNGKSSLVGFGKDADPGTSEMAPAVERHFQIPG